MMKTISMILVTLFLFGGHLSVDAQFGRLKRKIKNKVERKIDQKIDRKIDKTVDDAFEEVENGNEDSKKKKKKRRFDLSKVGVEEMELTTVYEFDVQIDWLMTSSEGDKPMQMNQMMSEKNQYFGMEIKEEKGKATQGTLIFDLSKEYMILIPEDQKQAMVTSMGGDAVVSDEVTEEEMVEEIDGSITATGKQKKILGYTCQQYIFTSEGTEGEMWITEEVDLPNYNLFSYMQKMSSRKSKQMPQEWEKIKDGFMLEMTSKDKKGNTSKLETIKINTNANVRYDMKKYQAINITGMEGLMGR